MSVYIDSKTYSFKRWSSFLETSLMTLFGLIAVLFAAMPREGRDYEGYIDLFSNKAEIQDIRNFEFISHVIYFLSSLTIPNLGFIIFGSLACIYTVGIVKKCDITNFAALFVFISVFAAYVIIGYGFYLRQFVALTIIGYAFLADKRYKWMHFAIAVGVHINTALMIFPVYVIYKLTEKKPLLVIVSAVFFSILTLLGEQTISSDLKFLLSSYNFSYGWYFEEFEADPIGRYLYNALLYFSVSVLVHKSLVEFYDKKILLPFAWITFIIYSEYFFSEFQELSNRISFALDFFAIIVLAKIISLGRRQSIFAFFLLIVVSIHGIKKGFDVL